MTGIVNISLTERDLLNLLTAAAEAGAAQVIAELMPEEDLVSQRRASDMFGRATVARWKRIGLIKPKRGGGAANSKHLYSVAELRAIYRAEATADSLRHGQY